MRAATFLSDLSMSGCVRAHLSDLNIEFVGEPSFRMAEDDIDLPRLPAEYQIGARIGISGRGYLTEAFYPLNLFKDGPYPENGVWHFPKPYRLFPGQRMRAEIILPAHFGFDVRDADADSYVFMPGIMFNGIKLSDNSPIMLYDRANINDIYAITALPASFLLNRETLQCPADSPVDLYSVTAVPCNDRYWHVQEAPEGDPLSSGISMPELMIYGPDDRKWWDQREWPQIVHPPTTLMDLNKPEWIMQPLETLTVEIGNKGRHTRTDHSVVDSTITVYITLRGSLEVTI
jgi:hypothetical protein